MMIFNYKDQFIINLFSINTLDLIKKKRCVEENFSDTLCFKIIFIILFCACVTFKDTKPCIRFQIEIKQERSVMIRAYGVILY